MAIDWAGGGYAVADWQLHEVDRATWADGALVRGFSEASVELEVGDEMPTMARGSITVDVPVDQQFREGYYRLSMIAEQRGMRERVDVATLWCESARGDVGHFVETRDVAGSSVLYPASRRLMTMGSYAPAGVDGARWVADLLSGSIDAPVALDEGAGFALDEHIVFEDGTFALDAAWLVLCAGSHVMMITGRGEVVICQKPRHPSLVLDQAHARLLSPGVSREMNWAAVPNRYVAASGSEYAMATNEDPSSPTSTVSRGFVVDSYDGSPVRVNGETLTAYCARRLEEESVVNETREYEREWWPGVGPYSVVRGSLSSVGLDGDMRVRRQQLTCGKGIVVEEQASREVSLWRRS